MFSCHTSLVVMFQLMWQKMFSFFRSLLRNTFFCNLLSTSTARRPGVMEVMHNLDYCDVLVIGEELNPERESLEIHHSALLGKHLDATNSTSGISIYGRQGWCEERHYEMHHLSTFNILKNISKMSCPLYRNKMNIHSLYSSTAVKVPVIDSCHNILELQTDTQC